MAVAAVIGAACGAAGLLVSYHEATAAGATMALCTVVAFFGALVVRSVATMLRRARSPPGAARYAPGHG